MQPERRKRPSGRGSSASTILATVRADDALATASVLEQQRVSIADALTVSLLSAAARWARRENGDGEGSKEEQPRG
jgi:hypothetical protein